MTCTITIDGPPRTKKTSSRLVTIPGKKDAEGNRGKGFTKILPSAAFEEWMAAAVLQGPGIRLAIQKTGVHLPFKGPVTMKAVFYRQSNVGDICGLLQAVCDAIQVPMYKFPCIPCKKATMSADFRGVRCNGCDKLLVHGKQGRQGLGIIMDDSLVKSTDGSRLLKDSVRPRVEITISEFTEEPVQMEGLFGDQGPEPIADEAAPEPFAKSANNIRQKSKTAAEPSRGLLKPGDPDY